MESVRNICAKIISQFRSRFPELYTKLPAFTELTRANKPIGIYLLLWPTISALWIAEEGLPRFSLLFIFVVGTALMRSAGCCINDFADHTIDGKVGRTQRRPLVLGSLTRKDAFLCFALLSLISFCLVFERSFCLLGPFHALFERGCREVPTNKFRSTINIFLRNNLSRHFMASGGPRSVGKLRF